MKARTFYDSLRKIVMYTASSISVIFFFLILYFVLSNGLPLLNFKIITGNNESITTNLTVKSLAPDLLEGTLEEGSSRYGLAVEEIAEGFKITYLHKDSAILKNNDVAINDVILKENLIFKNDKNQTITYDEATLNKETFIDMLNKTVVIEKMTILRNGTTQNIKTQSIYPTYELEGEGFLSKRYGVILIDSTNLEGESIIKVVKIHEDSPLKKAYLYNDNQAESPLDEGDTFYNAGVVFKDDQGKTILFNIKNGAEAMAQVLDQTVYISMLPTVLVGGGIRGSIITTLYLIIITLIIAVPIGIFTAVYLHEYARQNKFTELLRSLIDMLTGIPSIIYGLMGAALFIPLSQKIFGSNLIDGGTIISGSLTLAVIVLPIIIKSTESALDVVPKDYKFASLALGANDTQTTFKVILPNAIPGILSAVLLSIGRIMGESAALIYAIGTVVKDEISIFGNGTSLAVHIWTAMAGETPNFALASTISIIILVVVLTLNVLVKLITKRLMRKYQ